MIDPELQKIKDQVQTLEKAQEEMRKLLAVHRHTGYDGSQDVSTQRHQAYFSLLAVDNSPLSVGATFTIYPGYSYFTLTGSSGTARTSSASNAISDGLYSGQLLILEGTSNTNTITIKDGANTALAGDCSLGVGDTLSLIWNGTDWVEISRSDN